jgi:hypothetical protein
MNADERRRPFRHETREIDPIGVYRRASAVSRNPLA